ncbi:hypothetical protein SDC9_156262 [bioreactor metagenome]|uniref:Uncharacterized protein n=1 Tax=bioreactor metagenome TaxID=1076179 RepID=A0A645F8Q1_9ZZZZ
MGSGTGEETLLKDMFSERMPSECVLESVGDDPEVASKTVFKTSKSSRSICSGSITKMLSSIVESTYFRIFSGELLDLINSIACGLI